MYSIVLATMLTTGTATPTHFFHGCWGCKGCCGGCYGNAFSCYGCGGCYGCCGGCYGCWGCYGCCGGCYGCCGGYVVAPVYYGCGCCGGVITNGNGKKKKEELPEANEEDTGDEVSANRPATVVVRAPLDVKVRFNGQMTRRTAVEQRFRTPALERGKKYSYEIEATATRNGQKYNRTARVIVQAGKIARLDLTRLNAAKPALEKAESTAARPAAGKARITVKLPEDAKLYVDGVACPLTSEERSFETPKLTAGRTYYYTLKVEVERDGEKVTDGRRVTLKAGDDVVVEFKDLPKVEKSVSR